MTTGTEADTPRFTTLQDLMWPEQGVCTERDLYVRLQGAAGLSESRGEIRFAPGGRAGFDTWFNLFNIGKWQRHCALRSLALVLEGAGEFELSVVLAGQHQSWERVVNEIITLTPDTPETPARMDLSKALSEILKEDYDESVLFFELRALRDGVLRQASWQTTDTARRQPDLAIAVTTFRREAEVARTAARFARFIKNSPLKDHIRLIVTDNGRSAEIDETAHVSLVPNDNLGGAGGFSRGLIEARARGASHCLFMDDDASIHMASLERSWAFLAYAQDPATAIAGAMINASHRWSIWENGAVFNSLCRALYQGTDLRDRGQAFDMEFDTTGPPPDNFYGGWWFFAFAIDQVVHMPFPFFVRGDDISFSLVHDFNIVTLNGVVSFQESFMDKESPQTLYLDLRSHMAHHLSLPSMRIGRLRTLKIAAWFFMRHLVRMQYETLEALNLSFEDVLRGPGFFDANAGNAQRRADIKALMEVENWRPAPAQRSPDKWRFNPQNRWVRLLMKATLNGGLLPFFRLYGNRVTLEAQDRASLRWVWGAAEVTYLSANKQHCYTVRHCKTKMVRQCWRFLKTALRFLVRYDRLVDDWREGYGSLTTESYWHRKLQMSGEPKQTN